MSGLAKGPATAAAAIKAAVKRLSGDSAPDVPVGSSLKVHAVTFNMNTRLPTLMQTAALLGLEARPGHSHFHPSCDVYAVGSQESGGLKPWRKLISRCLGGHFVRLASESLMAISLMVYVRRSLANECLDISTTNIATGAAPTCPEPFVCSSPCCMPVSLGAGALYMTDCNNSVFNSSGRQRRCRKLPLVLPPTLLPEVEKDLSPNQAQLLLNKVCITLLGEDDTGTHGGC